jgi:hypothetical protein
LSLPLEELPNFKERLFSQATNFGLEFELVSKELNHLAVIFACLCQGFDSYEVKKYYFAKRKGKYFYTFHHFYSEKSSKSAK